MPYIITAYETIVEGDAVTYLTADGEEARPHAVATLEEAREAITAPILAASPHHVWHLAESGGTIGPLPDGTVIEVQPITWYGLAENAGIRGRRFTYVTHPAYVHGYTDEILAAYNAR